MLSNALSVHTQRWAQAFAQRGHDVHLFSVNSSEIEGVHVHPVYIGPKNSKTVFWKLLSYFYFFLTIRRRLKKLNPDIVNAHYASINGVIAAFSGFHPLVISVWGSDVIAANGPRLPLILRAALRYALKRADLICATSGYLAIQTRRFTNPFQRIERVPFGVDCDLFKPSDNGQMKNSQQFRIGFVKSLLPRYGPEFVIKAMPLICRFVPNAKLIMVGQGRLKNDLIKLARSLNVEDKVEFTGFVPNKDLPKILQTFDVFVLASLRESFGVVLLEAQACGVPVVATNIGGVPETCIDGQTAYLVPPEDSAAIAEFVLFLAKQPAVREQFARNARKFVLANYQWHTNVAQMLALFAELTNHNNQTSRFPFSDPSKPLLKKDA